MVDICGYKLLTNFQNNHAKRPNQSKNIPKTFRGYFFETPCTKVQTTSSIKRPSTRSSHDATLSSPSCQKCTQ